MLQLRDYQRRATNFALQKKSSYMMVDIGLGKTAIALKTAEQAGLPVMVWAPLRVAYMTWPDEIKKWVPQMTYTIMHGDLKNATLNLKRDIYILNYEGLPWFYEMARQGKFKLRKFFMVWDEASMLKDHRTKRWKTFADKMYPIYSKFRMHLSATPATEGLPGLWSQYYLLDNGKRLGQNYYSFFNKYFNQDQYTKRIYPKPFTEDQIHKRISDITFRLDAKDYKMFKDPVYTVSRISLNQKLREQYDELEKELLLEFAEEDILVEAATAESLSSKLQQLVQGALYYNDAKGNRKVRYLHYLKADALKELVETAQGDPILCPIQFRFEYDMICKVFKKDIPIIAGQTNAAQSVAYARQWNRGNLPLLLCHPRSLRYGLNLQEVGHLIIWYGLPWSLEDYIQLNGRLARSGQKKVVTINHLVMRDTIDETIVNVLRNKNATQQDLLDAMRRYCMRRS